MVIKKHSKRIYYSSGIISLMLLPILCFWFLEKRKVFQKETAIEINAYNTSLPKNSIGRSDFVDEYFRNPISKININSNPASFKIKLDSIRKLVAVINSVEYATNCVLVNFEEDARYETFIKVLDYLDSSKCQRYPCYLNKILIYNTTEEQELKYQKKMDKWLKNSVRPFCGTSEANATSEMVRKNEFQKKEAIIKLKSRYKDFYIIWILLSIMLILTFIKARGLRQIRQ